MAEWTEAQITTKVSPRSVTDTVSRLTGILSAKGMKPSQSSTKAPRRAGSACSCARPRWCCSAIRPQARR